MLQRISAALGLSKRQGSDEWQTNWQAHLDLEVYRTFRQQEAGWLTMHAQYARHYMIFVGAVLGISITLLQLLASSGEPAMLLGILFGPGLGFVLCTNGVAMCNHAYYRYLETVATLAKLEHRLRLTAPLDWSADRPFPNDKTIIPDRWTESWSEREVGGSRSSTMAFAEHKVKGGVNRVVRRSFDLLYWANAIFGALVILYSLLLLRVRPVLISPPLLSPSEDQYVTGLLVWIGFAFLYRYWIWNKIGWHPPKSATEPPGERGPARDA
ncbi:MAG: hypothetical protein ACYC3S_00370 [Chloroflexota bacterium]